MSDDNARLRELIMRIAIAHHVDQHDEGAPQSAARRLVAWLRQSPLHVAEYLDLMSETAQLPAAAERIAAPLAEVIAAGRDDAKVLEFPEPAAAEQPATSAPRRTRAWALAAGFAACLATLALVGDPRGPDASSQDFATGHGEQRVWQLADNTVVHLNSDTRVTVSFDQHGRAVDLAYGQALFEVAKDPARPFHVRAGNVLMTDIGTKFDVSRESSDTVVTVVEGQVAVSVPDSQMKVYRDTTTAGAGPAPAPKAAIVMPALDIRAGGQATIQPTGTVETVPLTDVRRVTAWTRQEIAFDNETVAQVARQFNRYNRRQIRIDNPRIANYRISGLFHSYDVESFVVFLASLHGVQIVRSGDTIDIAAPQPAQHRHS